jgi:hypothetical protein
MSSLFELSSNVAALEAALENETNPESLQVLVDELVANKDGLVQKIENYAGFIGELQAVAEARAAEAKRVGELAKQSYNKVTRLKDALREALLRVGTKKVSTARYDIRVQKAGGKLPLVIDEARVTEEWRTVKTVVETDKDRIRSALEAGEILDFAELKERGDVLIIK